MLDNIKLGQYLHGDSWYYRLDPRAKLIMTTIYIFVVFIANNWITYLGVIAFTLTIILTSGIALKFFYRSIRPIFFLMFFTLILNIFFYRTGETFPPVKLSFIKLLIIIYGLLIILLIILRIFKVINKDISGKIFKISTLIIIPLNFIIAYYMNNEQLLWSFNLVIYKGALINGGYLIIRLILIISMSSLLTFTTKPTDLTLAIEYVLSPLKLIKVPVSELALMISIALRFIPTLLEETQKILKAQTSRGADFTEGNLKDKVVQIISLLIPMFIISFKRAEDLANAMEARGYVPGRKRTSLRVLKWKFHDTLYVGSYVILITFLVYFRYFWK
ncbi:MAG TPA: energy-coupling factor transporter transmembrane component T [Haloplasmataceae bacterium]